MDFERARKQDVESRIQEALEKAKESQKRLNAVVTFVDPKEQLEHLASVDADAPMYGMPIVLKDNVNTTVQRHPPVFWITMYRYTMHISWISCKRQGLL